MFHSIPSLSYYSFNAYSCSFFHSLVQFFVPSFILHSFTRSFNPSFLSFVPFFVNSLVLSIVSTFFSIIIHRPPPPLSLFILSFIHYTNFIHLSNDLLQFAAILDACSSAVVVWRFSGIAGQKYSFERERK